MNLRNNTRLQMILCGLCLIALPAFAQDETLPDSLQSGKELLIHTTSASQPVTLVATEKAVRNPGGKAIRSSASLDYLELHPQAISFVKGYLNEQSGRLEKMKVWGDSYFRLIDQVLARNELPVELKYLAVIESELKTNAVSWAGAVGPWQFMPETGRIYGLKVNRGIDERRNLYKSTNAAARYLKDLYAELGDWLLVIAGYNGGSARVQYAIKKSGSRDFWKLQYYLPAESRNHVKKFIATHFYMEGGIGETTVVAGELLPGKALPAAQHIEGTRTVQVSGKYQSVVITKSLGMDILEFNKMNPGFDARVGVEGYMLRLPESKMLLFESSRNQILNESVLFLMTGGDTPNPTYPDEIQIPASQPASRKQGKTK